ncbi:MAG TPA: hypothetical protein VMF33_00065 [Acidimicrobiales bacterium]|nr:hypothetical protein [Acidimicrobiales bacterium]
MRRPVMRRLGVVTSALMVSATLTMSASASTSSLANQVLSLSQVGSGWFAETNSNTGVGCLHDLLEPSGVTQTHVAEVYFVHTGDVPFLDEKIATYSNAKTAFKDIAATIAACPNPSGPYKGYTSTGTVTKFSFPRQGNQSVAYQMIFKTGDITIFYDYVIARKNKVIVAVLEGSYPAVSTTQFTGFVHLAMAKVTS